MKLLTANYINLDDPTLTPEELELIMAQTDPVQWVSDKLNDQMWDMQQTIIESVRDNPKTTVRSCNGIGKSWVAGRVALWFLNSFPYSIVLTTAPTGRQVEKLIWKEIRYAYSKATEPLGGQLLPRSPELQIVQEQWYASGFATNDESRFQGYHEDYILIIVDEGSGVPENIFTAIEGCLTSSNARLLVLGNPLEPSGYFYKSHKEPGWSKIHISAFDTPNFTAFGITRDDFKNNTWEAKIGEAEMPNPKLITPSWAYDRYIRWKPDSPAYQARIEGNFPVEGGDQLIPLTWIELAVQRWQMLDEALKEVDEALREKALRDLPFDYTKYIEGQRHLGCDIAWYGDDKTVLAPRIGYRVLYLSKYHKQGTVETTGAIIQHTKRHAITMQKVDVGGIGGGVYDQLESGHQPAVAINFGETAMEPERFINRRSEMYWTVRELLDPDIRVNPYPLALPPDDDMIGDLSSIKYKIDGHGRVCVESKDELKKPERLGHSPDDGDAVVLAYAPAKAPVIITNLPIIDEESIWTSR